MSRLKTKGQPIAFRLPLAVDQALQERCEALGVTVRAWVALCVENQVRTTLMGQAEAKSPVQGVPRRVEATQGASVCVHLRWTSINGGLRRCQDCGAIRQGNGKWSNVRS